MSANDVSCQSAIISEIQSGVCSGSFLSYPMITWGCVNDCSGPGCNSGNCSWLKVFDLLLDIAGGVAIAIGAILLKTNKTLGIVLLAVGIALLGFGVLNTFTGLINP